MLTPCPRLPNLLIIGAMKASTTLLYELLQRHPRVWFPDEKEPAVFQDGRVDDPARLRAYAQLYRAAPSDARYLGDASTAYTKLPHLGPTPRYIHEALGQPRMIYIVRDPVSRTVSNFTHAWSRGSYPRDMTLRAALDRDPMIVDASRYHQQLAAYHEQFGPDSVLVLIAEHLHHDPLRVMRRVEAYLDIEPVDGWAQPLPAVNTAQRVRSSASVQRWTGKSSIARRIGRTMPTGVRGVIKRMLPAPPPAPQASEADRALVLDRLGDDLRALRLLLGSEIDCWPSVRALGLHEPRVCSTAAVA